MADKKTFTKKSTSVNLIPSQRFQDSRHIFQNPKVYQSVMGFSNRAQRFNPPYDLEVDIPFSSSIQVVYFVDGPRNKPGR